MAKHQLKLIVNENFKSRATKRAPRPYATYYYYAAGERDVNYAVIGRASSFDAAVTHAFNRVQKGVFERADTYNELGYLVNQVIQMASGTIASKRKHK